MPLSSAALTARARSDDNVPTPGGIVKARIVRIGNSRGIRLPKPLLEEAGLGEEVELRATEGSILISPARGSRAGWAQAAQQLRARGGISWSTRQRPRDLIVKIGSGSGNGPARGRIPDQSQSDARPRDQENATVRGGVARRTINLLKDEKRA